MKTDYSAKNLRLLEIYHTTDDEKERQRALDEIVKLNIPLALRICNKYIRYAGAEWKDDIVQEAMMGIIYAAGMFDKEKGSNFGTYAYRWIVAYVGRLVNEKLPTVRCVRSNNTRRLNLRYQKLCRDIYNENSRIRDSELADEIVRLEECTHRDIDAVRMHHTPTVSLDAPFDGRYSTDATILDCIGYFKALDTNQEDELIEGMENQELWNRFVSRLETLPQRNKEIVTMRASGATLQEIGEHFGRSRERIRQIVQEFTDGFW